MALHLFRSFLKVADHASYTRAAEALYLGQPTVYQHIRQLERMYGTRLVEQSGKRVRLTEHGRVLYGYAQRIVELAGEAAQVLSDDEALGRGTLILQAGTTPGEFLLPHICIRFQFLHPAGRFRLLSNNHPEQIDAAVREREIDLGFHSNASPVPGLTKTAFAVDELIAIAPAGHRFEQLALIDPAEMTKERFVLLEGSGRTAIPALIESWFAQEGIQVEAALTADNMEAIKVAVRGGAGVALVAHRVVRPDDTSLIVRRLVNAPTRQLLMVARDPGWQSHLLRRFSRYVLSGAWQTDTPLATAENHELVGHGVRGRNQCA
ncbi:MAG: LysR family transcriptional regulator [Dehalococcoidia bacterium]